MEAVAVTGKAALKDYLELTKPRITALVALTSLIGFRLASPDGIHFPLLICLLFGTILAASGAGALNMALEAEDDSRSQRTKGRPVPSGRLSVFQGIAFGTALTVLAACVLFTLVNSLTAFLALTSTFLYLGVYTPLKKRTWLCTLAGAVPGAIPALMGFSAAQNSLDLHAWWLFAVLFFWQLPHHLAIAWLYCEDYARARFAVLPAFDPTGSKTSRQILLQITTLFAVSVLPFASGLLGAFYLAGTVVLGIAFLAMGMRFAYSRSKFAAKQLLVTSVLYLPMLLALVLIDPIFR